MRLCMLALVARGARGLSTTPRADRVAILGAGSFGSAMALVAARAQPDAAITIWARRDAVVDEINGRRRNGRYLPEDADPFPPNVAATVHVPTVSGRVRDAETGLLLLVCPHAHLQIVQLPLSASPVATLQGRRESGSMVVEVGSGDWTFEADF